MTVQISDRVLGWIVLDGYTPSKEEALAMAVEIRTIRAARKGPELWGRHPTTGLWVQIDDGSHTAAEVAQFKTTYAAAGWTKLRYSNPFATRRAQSAIVGDGVDVLALELTKRIEREFYHDHQGGAVQTRAKVQAILSEALGLDPHTGADLDTPMESKTECEK